MLAQSWESQFCLSVRPSDCLSHACYVAKPNNALRIFWYHTKKQSLYFSDSDSGWWAMPSSVCNLRSNWSTPFKRRRLWQISAYNVSAVRDSEKSSIMTDRKSTTGFTDGVRTGCVTPKSPKGWLKKRFFVYFLIKFNCSQIKSATKFFVCENFRWQSYRITILHLMVYRYWRET